MPQFIATKNLKMPLQHRKCLIQPLNQGITKAFKAHYTRELYSNDFKALNANKETTMMDCWKSVTTRNVIDYIGTACDSIKQATINNLGKRLAGCVKIFEDFEGVTENIKNNVKNIMHIAQQVEKVSMTWRKEGGENFDRNSTRTHQQRPGGDGKTWHWSQRWQGQW